MPLKTTITTTSIYQENQEISIISKNLSFEQNSQDC